MNDTTNNIPDDLFTTAAAQVCGDRSPANASGGGAKRRLAKAVDDLVKSTPRKSKGKQQNFATREAWLNRAVEMMDGWFGEMGYKVPKNIRVSCGFPSVGAFAARKQRIGECWSSLNSATKHFEIFISPVIDKSSRVLDILLHEIIHAVVGLAAGHGSKFRRCAVDMGLQGKMTATIAGADLQKRLDGLAYSLGAYPHGRLSKMTNGRKKQTTRLLKVVCPKCTYTARVTSKWIEIGLPTCCCGTPMVAPDYNPDADDDDSSDGE